jgi:uncharacterized protein YjbI with pentapeptide repeats
MSTSADEVMPRVCQGPDRDEPEPECGAAIAAEELCLSHLGVERRAAYLAALAPGSDVDVRGVTFTPKLLAQLLDSFEDGSGNIQIGNADFAQATFVGKEESYFGDATFNGVANFGGAKFQTRANLSDVRFVGDATFRGATFAGDADFGHVIFDGAVNFSEITVGGNAVFYGSTFNGYANFSGARFVSDNVIFEQTIFNDRAYFGDAAFAGNTFFSCRAEVMTFERVVVDAEVTIQAAAKRIDAAGLRGKGRLTLRLRGATVDLTSVVFAGPVTVQGLQQRIPHVDESMLCDPNTGRPRAAAVASLRDLDVERLVLTDVDLSLCRFSGMHRVDQIRMDGRCVFAFDHYGGRRALAEEHHWRVLENTEKGRARSRLDRITVSILGKLGRPTREWMPAPDGDERAGPARLEVLYRQLRKATEDGKNEPGAASFYYGEMEMRRAATTRSSLKLLLWLYWATSGYGLRAGRSLSCLAVLIATTVLALTLFGFPASGGDVKADGVISGIFGPRPIVVTIHEDKTVRSFSPRVEKSTEIALNAVIFRGADNDLTLPGRYIDIVARLFGPLFLGLTLRGIRNQLKR